ncbi:DUF6624 domain-containing protein [Streptomyces sp. MI02-7b]|uniref:DUF6624 domain-containing protein n=1 Tax=Streptomyces sp. MI02-7b TaxID=462941 RepID=UPI0029A40FA6|nr:DUF6624 domain-containing protein [Streptomyces sp. MI02-7b]MDX3075844.1 hypothetical protein [Streptomyces sp. MI02-7b]
MGTDLMRCYWRAEELPIEAPRTAAARAHVSRVRAENTEILRAIIKEHGWPGVSLVGRKAATAAWLVAHHSEDAAFQELSLRLLRAAVAEGDAEAEHLAQLTDRCCARRRIPQIYGTQYARDAAGLTLLPVLDPQQLDDRRAALGLEPHAEYDERMLGAVVLLSTPGSFGT